MEYSNVQQQFLLVIQETLIGLTWNIPLHLLTEIFKMSRLVLGACT